MSRDSGKNLQKKHLDQPSESSEEDLAGTRMKHQADSPDGSLGKHRENSYSKDGRNSEHVMKGSHEDSQSEDHSPVKKTKKRTDSNSRIDSGSSGSEELERHKSHSEKRRHKKSHKHSKHYDDCSESDSELDDKEAKRKRKEEKRLRKEERRQRREERHRRRAERHASKQKKKHIDVTPPSDPEKDGGSDSDAGVSKRDSRTSREESDPKKLEIELREKALESLRAKKAVNH
jgi:serine/arginine repetitive matrix protein 1